MDSRDEIVKLLEMMRNDYRWLNACEVVTNRDAGERRELLIWIDDALRSLESAEPKTKNLGLCDVGVVGVVDGMGEKHPDGNYQLLVLHDKSGQRIEARVLNGALEAEVMPQPAEESVERCAYCGGIGGTPEDVCPQCHGSGESAEPCANCTKMADAIAHYFTDSDESIEDRTTLMSLAADHLRGTPQPAKAQVPGEWVADIREAAKHIAEFESAPSQLAGKLYRISDVLTAAPNPPQEGEQFYEEQLDGSVIPVDPEEIREGREKQAANPPQED